MQDSSADQPSYEAETVHRTLVLPGIQDTREDWEPLQELLRGKMELVFAKMPLFDKGNKNWRETKIAAYEHAAQEEGCTMLMGHSLGTHLAMQILLRSQKFTGSILLNPAKNVLGSTCEQITSERSRKPESVTELMMWEQTCDMDDLTFYSFADRHERNFNVNRAQIRREFELGRTGPKFSELYNADSLLPPTLIVRAPCDPWHITDLPNNPNFDIKTMDETYHYSHVSKANALAERIQKWLSQRIFPPKQARVLSKAA